MRFRPASPVRLPTKLARSSLDPIDGDTTIGHEIGENLSCVRTMDWESQAIAGTRFGGSDKKVSCDGYPAELAKLTISEASQRITLGK